MKVIRANEDSVVIEGGSGIQLTITDTPKGNLRLTETGKYIQNLHVIPGSGNSVVITSSRNEY